jgi:8-oxo-dGTP pyrophosphatase MutT (NUDIX family)
LIGRHEEPLEAALRESREEVGLDLEVTAGPTVILDAPGRRVDVIFEARLAAGSPAQQPVAKFPEIVEVRWFSPAGLPDLQEEAAGALSGRFVDATATGAPNQSRGGT